MKKILSIFLCITAVLCLTLSITSCGESNTVSASSVDYFECIDASRHYAVYYDRSTKVMYVSGGEGKTFTVLVDADGDPLLYKGD